MIAVNNLTESSFAGLMAQVQVFGRVGMAAAAAISDLSRDGFLKWPTTKKDFKKGIRGLFYALSEELQITSVMCAMKMAAETRETNNYKMEHQREAKRDKKELIKELGLKQRVFCILHVLFTTNCGYLTGAGRLLLRFGRV